MSQENVEIVRAAFEAWNRNDFDAWIQYFDPEVHWSAMLEEFRGHAGIRQAWQSFKVDLQLKARYEVAPLATFRDGRILSFRDFASHAEALEAVGLSE